MVELESPALAGALLFIGLFYPFPGLFRVNIGLYNHNKQYVIMYTCIPKARLTWVGFLILIISHVILEKIMLWSVKDHGMSQEK